MNSLMNFHSVSASLKADPQIKKQNIPNPQEPLGPFAPLQSLPSPPPPKVTRIFTIPTMD